MICAIIQARMSSTRLPGKVLKQINGRPMLSYMLERVSAAKNIDKIAVVTSIDLSDDSVATLCREEGVFCYRGSLDDVLDRYYQAAKELNAKVIVRLTGDCPLIDPKIIDKVVETYNLSHQQAGNKKYDYVANTVPPKWTVPEGMDVEVFSFQKLEQIWKETKKPSDREHVTFYFWQNENLFNVYRYNLDEDFSRYRLTVDYPNDFKLVKTIFDNLYPNNPLFSMEDIINFLEENPNLCKLNNNINSNQGWNSAYKKDQELGFV